MEKVIKQYFCDRCVEEIKEPFKDPTVFILRLHYTFHNGLSHVANCKDNIRLCPKCAAEFLKWMQFLG
jgi:hypothetical protein